MSWALLHNHSYFSFLDAISKPSQIIERCLDVGISVAALTDHGSISGIPAFLKAKKTLVEKYTKENDEVKLDKLENFKQILGCELYLCPQDSSIRTKENGKHSHLVVLSKNLDGWYSLVKAVNKSNSNENFYKKPRLSLDELSGYTNNNLIAFSGHMGSDLANIIFSDIKLAYSAKTYDDAKNLVNPNWKQDCFDLVDKYQQIFGKDNFYLEIQLIDQDNLPASIVVAKALRFISKKISVKKVATSDSHYPTRESAFDQRVVLCNMMNTTLKQVMRKIDDDDSDVGLGGFFRSDSYHIPTVEEMKSIHTDDEIANSLEIASMCEEYNIFAPPCFPKFKCPNNLSSAEHLKNLCREGYRKKIHGKVKNVQPYVDRIKEELEVWNSYDILNQYFLVVQDYVNEARKRGELIGFGRGSVGGCLTSYLLGISAIDPIEHGLSFQRFYNSGRNSPGRISLMDIDVDFEVDKRHLTLEYIQNKYGNDCVAQMSTFARSMGRATLKDTLRVHEACSAEQMNEITKYIPDEAAISDELQLMRDDGEDPSIIMWALKNESEKLKEWAYLDDKGDIQGKFAQYFKQAIRLEGNIRGASKHASGVIIADFPIHEKIPMIRDKSSDKLIIGVPMQDAESMSLTKVDLLGTTILSKIKGVSNLLSGGKI